MVSTLKVTLLQALDTAGFGYSSVSSNGSSFTSPNTTVTVDGLSLILYTKTKATADITTAQKIALATALDTAGFEYTAMNNQNVWDDLNQANVPGLSTIILAKTASTTTTA